LLNNTPNKTTDCALRCDSISRFFLGLGTRSFLGLLLSLLALSLAGCERTSESGSVTTVELRACRIRGIDTEVRCGDLEVPEQRLPATPTPARKIKIHFAVIHALARGKHLDPIFVFAGGPGQAATSVGGLVQPLFARLNRERDIVLIDQRGTGGSNALQCEGDHGQGNPLSELDPSAQIAQLAGCAAELNKRGNDLTQYTTPIAVQDFEAVRSALGYEQINLWGASYGTRVELEYLRQFPDHVRTATLDGVAPSTLKLPISSAFEADQALDRLISDCRSDAACSAKQPNFAARVDGLFARLAGGPIHATVLLPMTGQPRTLDVTRALVSNWVRAPLYSPVTASLIPDLIEKAAHEDFNPLITASEAVNGEITESISLGMHLSIICSEDMAHVSLSDVGSLESTRFGTAFFDQYKSLCAEWPRGRLPDHYFDPVTASVPVLLLSGGLDPATPPHYAAQVLKTLTHGRSLVAPNLAHGISPQGCAPDLIDRFIRKADPVALDAACLERIPRPPFFQAVTGEHS
jgi:pimeloyl-ACP methyl ester carboxylesterase